MEPLRLAIVGAGPYGTYALERLAAAVTVGGWRRRLEIHVFERTGEFGAGQVHSARQAETSLLNRIAEEFSFAADETVVDAGPLLPACLRPTLYQWCRRRFEQTGDEVFDLSPGSWPRRYLHGLALRHAFERYAGLLRACPTVRLTMHHDEVTDLFEAGPSLLVTTRGEPEKGVLVDHALLVTGQSYPDATLDDHRSPWPEIAASTAVARVPFPYPLEVRLPAELTPAGSVVGCAGTMLTAIDVILHLTEGRGGRFEHDARNRMRYVPSGREPGSIVAFSGSGLFPYTRPVTISPPEVGGSFLCAAAIDRLRSAFGVPRPKLEPPTRQLDFERHILPLIVIEMAHAYYSTLLGNEFARHLAEASVPAYESFLTNGAGVQSPAESIAALLAPMESILDEVQPAVDGFLSGKVAFSDLAARGWKWSVEDLLHSYTAAVFGPEFAKRLGEVRQHPKPTAELVEAVDSRWRHPKLLGQNRYSWEQALAPIPRGHWKTPQEYREALIEFMTTDIAWAVQGVAANPLKTAVEATWRGLRSVVAYAVDGGGLVPSSHRTLRRDWLRRYNRLSYGPAPEVMSKILALAEHGVLDVSTGPDACVRAEDGVAVVTGRWTNARQRIDVLVEARVPSFDARADGSPLYANLLRRGLIRQWVNPGLDGEPGFTPGGLDLTDDLHPIRADGAVDRRLTFLGPCVEGKKLFRASAMKPGSNHEAMGNIARWLRDLRTAST